MTEKAAGGEIVIEELERYIEEHPTMPKPWTEKELAVLRSYYGRVPTRVLAEHMGRSYDSVARKAQRLGLGLRGGNGE